MTGDESAKGVQQLLDVTVRSESGEVIIEIGGDDGTATVSTTPEGAYRISESIKQQARVAKVGEFDV